MTPTKIVKKGKSKKAVSAVGGGGVMEETRLDEEGGGGRSPFVYGGQIEQRKKKNRESVRALSFDGITCAAS
jgi:hypothetical protein